MVEFPTFQADGAVEICGVDHLWDGEMQAFRVGDTPIVLLRIDGRFHAYHGRCPHQGADLADGDLDDGLLTCAAHGWQFDATTGRGVNPQSAHLKCFAVQVVERKVLVQAARGDPYVVSESAPPSSHSTLRDL
jgi:nitrite reductase/ring-hydroxylating ferredoxin subunit